MYRRERWLVNGNNGDCECCKKRTKKDVLKLTKKLKKKQIPNGRR